MSRFDRAAEVFGKAAMALGKGIDSVSGGGRDVFGDIVDPAADIDAGKAHNSVMIGGRERDDRGGPRGDAVDIFGNEPLNDGDDKDNVMDMRLI